MQINREVSRSISSPIGFRECEIDIWQVDLDSDTTSVDQFFETLSKDEKNRAIGFRFSKDRDHFVFSRGWLRKVIGRYFNIEANAVRFRYNEFGKPFLDIENNPFRFNVSHSRGVGLIAVTIGQEIGVDIEFIDRDLDILGIAQSVFSPIEIAALKALETKERTGAFFEAWARKEAFLKAIGQGFSYPPDLFEFSAVTDEHSISFRTNMQHEDRIWSVTLLPLGCGYSAAVAVEGQSGSVRFMQLTDG